MQLQEMDSIKSQHAQLEEKHKQLEHVYQILEGKMHLEVAELEAKLKDAHTIHDTS